jgi:hypothetical protein
LRCLDAFIRVEDLGERTFLGVRTVLPVRSGKRCSAKVEQLVHFRSGQERVLPNLVRNHRVSSLRKIHGVEDEQKLVFCLNALNGGVLNYCNAWSELNTRQIAESGGTDGYATSSTIFDASSSNSESAELLSRRRFLLLFVHRSSGALELASPSFSAAAARLLPGHRLVHRAY